MSEPEKLVAESAENEAAPASESGQGPIWHLPNQLTVARLILSVVFFVILAIETHWNLNRQLVLNVCFVVFILAVITDFLDGYLARLWGLTSTFGRIADPFADKIVICGGFVMLTGITNFVAPWFAVVIIFREFLVSGLRSFFESRGVAFGAALSGKLKMLAQSITIPVVLFYEANVASPIGQDPDLVDRVCYLLTVGCLTLTLILTVTSCVGYLQRAYLLIQDEQQ